MAAALSLIVKLPEDLADTNALVAAVVLFASMVSRIILELVTVEFVTTSVCAEVLLFPFNGYYVFALD